MGNIIIRMANKDEVPELLPLMLQLGYTTNSDLLEKRFEKFTNFDGYGIAVACDDARVVGWIAWSKSELFVLDKTRIHIEGIVVDEKERGRGVGKKLMYFLEEYAKKFSPAIIDLTSGLRRTRDGPHDFYKILGYHNEGLMAKLYLRKEI